MTIISDAVWYECNASTFTRTISYLHIKINEVCTGGLEGGWMEAQPACTCWKRQNL